MPIALARARALAGLTPSRFWLSRSQRAAPSMAASSQPTWKRPTSLQMSSQPTLASSGNSALNRCATSERCTLSHSVLSNN
eukprot:305836-Alexandrium_andersonii.AAC.1